MFFWIPYLTERYSSLPKTIKCKPRVLSDIIDEYLRTNRIKLTSEWRFPLNRQPFQHSGSYFNMEWLGDREYPVFILPKGIYLYTYSQNDKTKDDVSFMKTRLFNMETPDIKQSYKFFYPIPYIAETGVSGKSYDMCFICKTTQEIRLICMIAPSVLNRQDSYDFGKISTYKGKEIPYFDKGFMYRDSYDDPHMTVEFQQKYHIQGYIAIAGMDSFSHGKKWDLFEGRGKISGFTEDVLKTAIYKSAFNAHRNEDPVNSFFQTFCSIEATFGVPEIVLSPLSTMYYNYFSTSDRRERLQELYRTEPRQCMNYECVEIVRNVEDLPSVIQKQAVCEFDLYPLFHMDQTLVSNCHPMTLWTELRPNHLDFQSSTSTCKIETVGYHRLMMTLNKTKKKSAGIAMSITTQPRYLQTSRKYVLHLQKKTFEKYQFGEYEYWFGMANKIPIIIIR